MSQLFGRQLQKDTDAAERSFLATNCARNIRQWLRALHHVRAMSKERSRNTSKDDGNVGTAIDMLVAAPEVNEVDPLFQQLDKATERLVGCIELQKRLYKEQVIACADGPTGDFRQAIVAACQGRDLINTLYESSFEDRSLLRVNWEDEGQCEMQVGAFWQCIAPAAEFSRESLEFRGLAMFETVSYEVENRKTLLTTRN